MEVARALLAAGAQLGLTATDTGISSLWVASQCGHLEVVSALLSAGARVDTLTAADGHSHLFVACLATNAGGGDESE